MSAVVTPRGTSTSTVHVSVLIPAKDEAENLSDLFVEIADAFAQQWAYEVIVIDDGSADATDEVMQRQMFIYPWLRYVRHDRSAGKSAALRSGALCAEGQYIVTMDGDGQNNPADVPGMIALLEKSQGMMGLVAAQRTGRTDSGLKKLASKFANGLRSGLFKDGTRDTANGLKAIRRDLYLALPFFDTMHRFFPALTVREGYTVGHIDVVDRARRHGQSKYGILDRLLVGMGDMIGVYWLIRRRKTRPAATEVNRDPV